MWRSPCFGEVMGCDKAQKWILSGIEAVREPPGLPSVNASAGACVSLSFPCLLDGLAAPVRLDHGVCWGEHEGALGRESTIAATNPVVVALCFCFFFPSQKVILFQEACSLPQLAVEMQCFDIFPRYYANKHCSQTPSALSPTPLSTRDVGTLPPTLGMALSSG